MSGLVFIPGNCPVPALINAKEIDLPGAKISRRFAELPLEFAKNEGQFNAQIKFAARGQEYSTFLTSGGATIELETRKSEIRSQNEKDRLRPVVSRQFLDRPEVLQLRLAAANRAAKVFGLDKQSGKANYFIGKYSQKWRTNVPLFSRVEYASVYRGIDLIFHGNQQRLEFDFVLVPGADARSIRLRIETPGSKSGKRKAKGEDQKTKFEKRKTATDKERIPTPDHKPKFSIAMKGDLVIKTPGGDVRFLKPIAYQPVNKFSTAHDSELATKNLKPVRARFVLLPNNEVGFKLGNYDRSRPLVIDPVLDYSSYFGGTGFDEAAGIAVDAAGYAYIAGYTTSADLPVASPLQSSYGGGSCNNDMSPSPCFDAFVAKLNSRGTGLVYATYLGGNGDDRATGIAVNSLGEVFVAGYTGSADFPVANALQGAIGGGTCGSITNPYPCYDAFVAKLSASGSSLVYSTYLGGSGDDYATGVAIDSSLDAYITGFSSGGNFPLTSGSMQPSFGGGSYDAFVAKINAAGSSLLYSTFLGGSNEDRASAIAVDSSGSAYVTGQTDSSDFPVQSAFQSSYGGGSCGCFDAFVTKLNPTGAAAVYSTYLGGTGGDYGNGIAVDSSGEAYVAGWTTSADFPVTSGAFQRSYGGSDDVFVTKLNAAGNALLYSTYFGGIDPEVANGIALDSSGDALITGNAYGVGLPALNPLQSADNGYYDAFVAALNPSGSGLLYATWLGGSGDDFGNAIAADSSGNAYVAGGTFSTDFPTTPGSLASSYAGGAYDAFVAKIAPANAPGLSVIPDPVTFGDQDVGSTSSAQSVSLMNSGSAALSLAGVSASGDFQVTNHCPASIPGGTSCRLNLTFGPTAIGDRIGTLSITDNAGGSPQSVALAGQGTSGTASLSASSLDFGSVEAGSTSAPQTVALQNTGTTPLLISSIQATGDYSQSNNCGTSLAAGATCALTITFSPAAAGRSVGQLSITDSAPASPQTVSFSGTGTAPVAELSPSNVNFGSVDVGSSSSPQTITLTNSGSASLSITSISASAGFSETNDCGSNLTPGANCAINIVFSPGAAGTNSGTISVEDNAAGSPQSVALAGTGEVPFAIAAASRSIKVLRGTNQVNFVISVTSATGFDGTINLACTANGSAVCQFAPAAVQPGGSSTLSVSNLSSLSTAALKFTVDGTSGTSSAALGLSISFMDFSLAVSPSSDSVSAGSSAAYDLSLTPINGFNLPVSITCSGAPSQATCSASPSSFTPSVGSSSSISISVATSAGSAPPFAGMTHAPGGSPGLGLVALGLLLLAFLKRWPGHSLRSKAWTLASKIMFAGALAVLLAGCGGGGGPTSNNPATQGTPVGTYTLTIQASSGSLNHSKTVILVVN